MELVRQKPKFFLRWRTENQTDQCQKMVYLTLIDNASLFLYDGKSAWPTNTPDQEIQVKKLGITSIGAGLREGSPCSSSLATW
jgi:hypothetical protein